VERLGEVFKNAQGTGVKGVEGVQQVKRCLGWKGWGWTRHGGSWRVWVSGNTRRVEADGGEMWMGCGWLWCGWACWKGGGVDGD
jgi:hypothetical protein